MKMKNTSKILLYAAIVIVLSCAVAALVMHNKSKSDDVEDCFTAYDDIISFIVQGYSNHWEESFPEDLGLSAVYQFCSPCGGFCKIDIDGNGADELLLGDEFEDGTYLIYDIYTYDKTTGDVTHLFKGGERDWCVFNGEGIACETGSNSAFDSYTGYYKIDGDKWVQVDGAVQEDLKIIHFTRFTDFLNTEN